MARLTDHLQARLEAAHIREAKHLDMASGASENPQQNTQQSLHEMARNSEAEGAAVSQRSKDFQGSLCMANDNVAEEGLEPPTRGL
jgi:hypothetical protein